MRLHSVLVAAVVVAVALLAAPFAGAKEGVEALLLTSIPNHAAPGSTLHIEWRLADLEGHPFGANDIFVRLESAQRGRAATTALATERSTGRFAATVAVPAGGIRTIRIGLHGTTDIFFPVVNNPFGDMWAPLHRSLHVPTVDYGAPCPVSAPAPSVDFGRFGVGRGYGPGPAYPIGLDGGTLHVVWGDLDVDARIWGVQKVLWFVHPRYRGPVLIRGHEIGGTSVVRFERGRIPPAELRLPPGTRDRPSYTRIKQPGCYAYQIDGTTFSRTIVFRAVGG